MELKEYLAIFKKHLKLFLGVITIFLLAGLAWQFLQPLTYKSSLTLNVTRIGTQKTDAYRYDGFYRLQADERFADTVVRWLQSPRIVADIYNDAKIMASGLSQRTLSKIFKAQRLSSQEILVTYVTSDSRTAQTLAESIVKVINSKADELNKFQKEENWFTILGSEPVVRENRRDTRIVLFASLVLGAFLGFWAVLIRHYLT
jgi:capsular polysaccharide biosynthesis protein